MRDISKPLVSIGMPVHNGAKTLAAAIRSIMLQTFENWELLLIDDGSVDDTNRIIENFNDSRIRIFRDGVRRGLPARLNQSITLAKGSLFARMDADDLCYPDRFAKQVSFLVEHPEIDLLATLVMVFNDQGLALGSFPAHATHEAICAKPWTGFYFPHPTWMGRIEWFRKNTYNIKALRAQDQDLLLRSYLESRFATIPEILLGYRLERISLKNRLYGRYIYTKSLWQQVAYKRNISLIRGLIEQPIRGLADVIIVGAGAKGMLFQRDPVDHNSADKCDWEAVWRTCNLTN